MSVRKSIIAAITLLAWLLCASVPHAQMTLSGVGSAGGTPAVTWDPVNIGTNITLSNGNLTATSGSAGDHNTVRSTTSHATGKYYFEISWPTLTFSTNFNLVGLVNATFNLTTNTLQATTNSEGWVDSGSLFYNNGNVGPPNPEAWNSGTPSLGIAIDLDNALIWCRKNAGNWNNDASADPATGTTGLTFSPTGAVFIAATAGDAANVAVLNAGGSSYNNPAPSGFGKWQQ